MQYINVILPLAVDKLYSYKVPDELGTVMPGMRVEVQFGKRRHYGALVAEITAHVESLVRPKSVLQIIDEKPIVTAQQLKMWEWMAHYYCCTMGEVMAAALPSIFKLNSESVLRLASNAEKQLPDDLTDEEYLIAEALTVREQIGLEDARLILERKNVYPVLESLMHKGILEFREELKRDYRPKMQSWLHFAEEHKDTKDYGRLFEILERAPAQTNCLLEFISMKGEEGKIPLRRFLAHSQAKRSHVNALVDRGILDIKKVKINRMLSGAVASEELTTLDAQQERAYKELSTAFEEGKPVLLHGVTGSGKTRIYVEAIREAHRRGKQVLYLLPEIALTTQIESRLRRLFGQNIISYHSRLNNQERVDAWRLVADGFPLVLAARSGVFLPFKDLGLIIVDESHDSSYKQQNPAPRYHGRDVAIFLSHLYDSQVIMGTATPSLESFYNADIGKYHKVEMPERHGEALLPEIHLIALNKDRPLELETDIFSQTLLTEIEQALSRKKQVILFQNRRGYAPLLLCSKCDWKAECVHCDVSLTVHKYREVAQCHFCNYKIPIPSQCPKCNGQLLRMSGFGTEKIVEELKEIFPDITADRLDYDTSRGKKSFQKIIDRFAYGESQILVGTQMITKGLDFDNVAVVGILLADQALYYPEFRANELAYQLFTQVSGRAGRRTERGKVLVQTYRKEHPIFQWLLDGDYDAFVQNELLQRKKFHYPPYIRLIRITGLHHKVQTAQDATRSLMISLRKKYGNWVSPMAPNSIPRIKGKYIFHFLLKVPKSGVHNKTIRDAIQYEMDVLSEHKIYRRVRFIVDVDPVF